MKTKLIGMSALAVILLFALAPTMEKGAPDEIKTEIDPHANIAYYLGLRPKPRS